MSSPEKHESKSHDADSSSRGNDAMENDEVM